MYIYIFLTRICNFIRILFLSKFARASNRDEARRARYVSPVLYYDFLASHLTTGNASVRSDKTARLYRASHSNVYILGEFHYYTRVSSSENKTVPIFSAHYRQISIFFKSKHIYISNTIDLQISQI